MDTLNDKRSLDLMWKNNKALGKGLLNSLDIGVIGAGYVGLVTALGLSKIGHNVINYEKIF